MFQLCLVLTAYGLIISRLGLILHEFVGHGLFAILLGGYVKDYYLFWFGGGYVYTAFPAPLPFVDNFMVYVGGLLVELIVAVLLVRWYRRRSANTHVTGLMLTAAYVLCLHVLYYGICGVHYGFGDGRIVHILLNGATAPWTIPAAVLFVVIAYFLAREFFRALRPLLTHYGCRRPLLSVVTAVLVAAGVHLALTVGESYLVYVPKYSTVMTSEAKIQGYRPVPLYMSLDIGLLCATLMGFFCASRRNAPTEEFDCRRGWMIPGAALSAMLLIAVLKQPSASAGVPLAERYSINTLSIDGAPIHIFIEAGHIVKIENGFGADATLDLRDQVVFPPLIDAHNHPVPYNFGDAAAFAKAVHPKSARGFASRFEWRALSASVEDPLRTARDRLNTANTDGACAMYQYASLLDVGAAVIQGLRPPATGDCARIGGLGVSEVLPRVAEVTLMYEPGSTTDIVRARLAGELKKIAESDLAIVHLAEGRPGNPQIEEEINVAYGTDVLNEAGNVIVHGNGLTAKDLQRVRALHAGIIWSPVSQAALYSEAGIFNVKQALDLGITVGLGSDWNLTGSANILREIAAAQTYLMRLYGYDATAAARLALDMASVHNAQLLKLVDYDGIAAGNIASLTFVPQRKILVRGALDVSGLDESDVTLQLMRGKPIFGDAAVLVRLVATERLEMSAACKAAGVEKSVAAGSHRFAAVRNLLRQYFPSVPDVVQCQ